MKYCPACQSEYPATQRFCLEDGRLLSLRDPYHLIGRTLVGKYRIDALVGVGGMGAVYSARHMGIDRHVAVKILQPNIAVGDAQVFEMFEREARLSGHLTHANIANVFDAGRTPDGIAYIAMEWLEGETLDERIRREGRLDLPSAGAILAQIAAALDAAHAEHIVHRDLKPSNIMLVRRSGADDAVPHVKVLDFGIAKVISETTAAAVSAPMGTPHYASPEQFRTGAHIDGRADVYSLGVVLFRMLTGTVPFPSDSVSELIQRQLHEPPPPLRLLRPEAPEDLEALINRLLAKDPAERPQYAREVAELYFQALGEPLPSSPGASLPTPSRPGATTGGRKPWSTARFDIPTVVDRPHATRPNLEAVTGFLKARRIRAALIAAVVIGLAIGGVWYWRSRTSTNAARRQLAVVGFVNVSGDRELDALERIAPELLRQKLLAIGGLTIIGSEPVADAVASLGRGAGSRLDRKDAQSAARLAGAGAVITGEVARAGPRLQLRAEVSDAARGGLFFSASVEGEHTDAVFEMIDTLGARIASHYGIDNPQSPRVADLTTRSYDALRFFQTGYDQLLAHDFAAAAKNLDNATKIDREYALAFLHLGRAHRLNGDRARSREAFDRALALRDHAGPYERFLIDGYAQWAVKGDRAKAREAFESLLVLYPRDKEALLALTILHRELREYDRSIDYGRRAISLDPNFSAAWNAVGYSYLFKHDYPSAIDAFKRYAAIEPNNPNPYDSLGDTYTEAGLYDEALAAYQRSFEIRPDFYAYSALWKKAEVYFAKGDHASARAQAGEFLRSTTDRYRVVGEQTLARIEFYEGRLKQARRHFSLAREAARRAGNTPLEVDAITREAGLLAGLRQPDEALRLIGAAQRIAPDSQNLIGARVSLLSLSGRHGEARAEFAARGLRAPSPLDFELRAREAQSRGDFSSAVGLWKNLREQQPAVARGYDLGAALLAAGQAEEAERELRAFIKARPIPDLGSTSPISPLYDVRHILAHYELGRALDALGRRESAEEYYRRFLDFWGGADFKLAEIDDAARRVK